MYLLKILLGMCMGTGIGWLSGFINNQTIVQKFYLNNSLHHVAIFLMKLTVYFIILVGASFAGIEFMLSVGLSMTIVMIIIGIRNFIHG